MRIEASSAWPTPPENRTGLAVQAKELVKRYGNLVAVNRINLQIESGQTFGILGPNGAGKSTLMRMIYCRTPLTAGRLWVQGIDTQLHSRKIRSVVGIVPQEDNLDQDLNVIENLQVYARYFRMSENDIREQAQSLLEFMHLEEKRLTPVETLSGGMKRRLVVARALINRPGLLVLDEPTTGLDPSVRHDLWDRLRELRRKQITILLSTHYMEEAEQLCDQLVIMDRGLILASGPPKTLIADHALTFVLEVRESGTDSTPALDSQILYEVHGSTRYYFAPSPELLTPLINHYSHRRPSLRPSNLEDVFLRLTGRRRLE